MQRFYHVIGKSMLSRWLMPNATPGGEACAEYFVQQAGANKSLGEHLGACEFEETCVRT